MIFLEPDQIPSVRELSRYSDVTWIQICKTRGVLFPRMFRLSFYLITVRIRHECWASWGGGGGSVVKNPPASAGDVGLNSDPGRSHMPQSN